MRLTRSNLTKKPPKKPISIAKLKANVQQVFNKFIRQRDSKDGFFTCISCGKRLPVEKMNAGHWFPIKGFGHLRYNEFNVNGECCGCNGFRDEHLIYYSINLKKKIGKEAFYKLVYESLETKPEYKREELEDIIETYKLKLKQ